MVINPIKRPDWRTNTKSKEQSKLWGQNRSVFVLAEVCLKIAEESLSPFIVNVGKLSVGVLGTQVNISAYPQDGIVEAVQLVDTVSLTSDLNNSDSQNNHIRQPIFKGHFNQVVGKITENEVVTDVYTSWVKDEWTFRGVSLKI